MGRVLALRKPYYQDNLATLYLGDMRKVIPELTGSFDAVVTDPPYGETQISWDIADWAWLAALPTRALWCFGSMRMFMLAAVRFAEAGWRISQDIVWEKHQGSGLHADRFRRVHEHAVLFYKGPWSTLYHEPQVTYDARSKVVRKKARPAHWHGAVGQSVYRSEDDGPRLMHSVIRLPNTHGRSHHPTEKPVGIVVPLVGYSVPPGGIVLDPFAGSGSTLLAAKQLGRCAVGVEISERYCEVAAQRLAQEALPLVARG